MSGLGSGMPKSVTMVTLVTVNFWAHVNNMVVGGVLSTATRTEIYVANIEATCLASILDGFRPAPNIESSKFFASFDIRACKIEARCHLTSILHRLPVPSSFDIRCPNIEAR